MRIAQVRFSSILPPKTLFSRRLISWDLFVDAKKYYTQLNAFCRFATFQNKKSPGLSDRGLLVAGTGLEPATSGL